MLIKFYKIDKLFFSLYSYINTNKHKNIHYIPLYLNLIINNYKPDFDKDGNLYLRSVSVLYNIYESKKRKGNFSMRRIVSSDVNSLLLSSYLEER